MPRPQRRLMAPGVPAPEIHTRARTPAYCEYVLTHGSIRPTTPALNIPARKVINSWRFAKADLLAWLSGKGREEPGRKVRAN
jgi:hypothetical protein